MSGKKATGQLLRLRKRKDIIPGIHNYCDRWCERCAFTARCSVYAIGEEEERIHQQSKEPEKDLAEYVGAMLQDAMDLLHGMALEQGIDLNSPDDEETEVTKPDKGHYLVRKADEHSTWMIKWFKNNTLKVDNILATLEQESINDYLILSDAIEVLKWYVHFIAVKFSRAIITPYANSADGRYDSNGSAKIALIAVNRSIESMMLLLKFVSDEEDHLLQGLVRLERIRKRALREFPEAMAFKRPGFDD